MSTLPKEFDTQRYKKTFSKLSSYGTYAEMFDLTSVDVIKGETKLYYRVNIASGNLANEIREHSVKDPAFDKLFILRKGNEAYTSLLALLARLGLTRNNGRMERFGLIKRTSGYIMELSQTAFTYTENENSTAQRDARANTDGPASKGGRTPFNLDEPTGALLKQTVGTMANCLHRFEKSNPQESTSWQLDNWSTVCIDRIRKALSDNRPIDAMNYLMFAQHHGWDVSDVLGTPQAKPIDPDDWDARTVPYTFKTYKDYCDYKGLYSVLMDALDQAAYGKGNERHANDLAFEDQRMQTISDLLNSPDGMAYQVAKKTMEALSMTDSNRKKREILGAINYAAGIIIWDEKQPTKE